MSTKKRDRRPRGRPKVFGEREPLTVWVSAELKRDLEDLRRNTDPSVSMNSLVSNIVRHWMGERDKGRVRPLDLFPVNGR